MKIIHIGEHLLKQFQINVDPSAVIAGGWVRDQFFGKVPKDIDIWTTVDFKRKQVTKMFKGATKVRRFTQKTLTDKRLIHVTKFTYKGVDVDIVCFDASAIPDKVSFNPVDSFDFGICQCWFAGADSTGYRGTELFWNDLHNRTLTYVDTPINNGRLHQIVTRRIPKLLEKFPDFTVRGLTYNSREGTYLHNGETVQAPPATPRSNVQGSSPRGAEGVSMVENEQEEGVLLGPTSQLQVDDDNNTDGECLNDEW